MGQEIDRIHFDPQDFKHFSSALQQETALLAQWVRSGELADREYKIGFELESWLITPDQQPAPLNQPFLERYDSELVSPELAKFNIEFNTEIHGLAGDSLKQLEQELNQSWQKGQQIAQGLDHSQLLAIGILPTVTPQHLCQANMTEMKRYRALNEQVMGLRQGRPLVIDIHGREHLHLVHSDLMLESTATSFQIHLQTPYPLALRHYNASKIASAPLVAVSANSPLLFGHQLWDESRIPLFQQSVAVHAQPRGETGPHSRVTFGEGYIHQSLLECFDNNLRDYEVLLPLEFNEATEQLPHLRLHNGTIWRWNRPLVGFDHQGRPHLRIEHRVQAAGPTIVDMVANAALFYGLTHSLATQETPPEQQLPFATTRANFYHAARHGLEAEIIWLNGKVVPLDQLLLEQLIPQAQQGLDRLGVDSRHSRDYLDIIAQRTLSKQNGAQWQRAYLEKYDADLAMLTAAYQHHQAGGEPVHCWSI